MLNLMENLNRNSSVQIIRFETIEFLYEDDLTAIGSSIHTLGQENMVLHTIIYPECKKPPIEKPPVNIRVVEPANFSNDYSTRLVVLKALPALQVLLKDDQCMCVLLSHDLIVLTYF